MSYIEQVTRGVVAIATVGGGIYLLSRGIDHIVGVLLLTIVGYYFGYEVWRAYRDRTGGGDDA